MKNSTGLCLCIPVSFIITLSSCSRDIKSSVTVDVPRKQQLLSNARVFGAVPDKAAPSGPSNAFGPAKPIPPASPVTDPSQMPNSGPPKPVPSLLPPVGTTDPGTNTSGNPGATKPVPASWPSSSPGAGSKPSETEIDTNNVCSNYGTARAINSNVLLANSLELDVYEAISTSESSSNADGWSYGRSGVPKFEKGNLITKFSKNVREKLINEKKLLLPGLEPGDYLLTLKDPEKPYSKSLLAAGFKDQLKDIFLRSNSQSETRVRATVGADNRITVASNEDLWSLGRGSSSRQNSQEDVLGVLYSANDDLKEPCDYRVSPLMVDMSGDISNANGITLTAPLDGIRFDILGSNSFPTPHTPKQISWLSGSAQQMLIVLPDKDGQVHGIDQLFGDNTKGPDGGFAQNGFAALAKYDGKDRSGKTRIKDADGIIDSSDPIFNELRLWGDANHDGVADPGELFTLSEKGVVAIDLNYDSRFSETDRYGNQSKYKSVMILNDGSYRIVYDVWFRIIGL